MRSQLKNLIIFLKKKKINFLPDEFVLVKVYADLANTFNLSAIKMPKETKVCEKSAISCDRKAEKNTIKFIVKLTPILLKWN